MKSHVMLALASCAGKGPRQMAADAVAVPSKKAAGIVFAQNRSMSPFGGGVFVIRC